MNFCKGHGGGKNEDALFSVSPSPQVLLDYETWWKGWYANAVVVHSAAFLHGATDIGKHLTDRHGENCSFL